MPPLCSKANDKGKGTISIPLRSDPYAYIDQQPVVGRNPEEIESTVLVKSFLQSCLKLMRDERALREMQSLIYKCEYPVLQDVANRSVHQIKKYI